MLTKAYQVVFEVNEKHSGFIFAHAKDFNEAGLIFELDNYVPNKPKQVKTLDLF